MLGKAKGMVESLRHEVATEKETALQGLTQEKERAAASLEGSLKELRMELEAQHASQVASAVAQASVEHAAALAEAAALRGSEASAAAATAAATAMAEASQLQVEEKTKLLDEKRIVEAQLEECEKARALAAARAEAAEASGVGAHGEAARTKAELGLVQETCQGLTGQVEQLKVAAAEANVEVCRKRKKK